MGKGGQVPSFWYTDTEIFKIHKVEIKLGRNLVGGLGHLGRKTKQTNNPFVSGSRKFTLPGGDPIF